MPKKPISLTNVPRRRPAAGAVGVLERPKAAPVAPKVPSPHVLDLADRITAMEPEVVAPMKGLTLPPRGMFARMRHAVDGRIHLHDLRMRTLSIRPRGWKDFPPQGTTTLEEAVRVTGSRFLAEHPIAELTMARVLRLASATIWHASHAPQAIAAMRDFSPALPELPAFPALPTFDFSKPDRARIASPRFHLPLVTIERKRRAEPTPASPQDAVRTMTADAARKSARTVAHAPSFSVPRIEVAAIAQPVVEEPPLRVKVSAASIIVERKTAAVRPAPQVVTVTVAEPKKIEKRVAPTAAPTQKRMSVPPKAPSRFDWQKPLLAFAGLALVFVIPITVYGTLGELRDRKNTIMEQGVTAAAYLRAAAEEAKAQDFDSATASFAAAGEGFAETKRRIGALSSLLDVTTAVMPGTRVSAANSLLEAGGELAVGGESLAKGASAMNGVTDPAAKIEAVRPYLGAALPHLENATRSLSRVSPDAVPAEYRDTVVQAQRQLPILTAAVRKATAVSDALQTLLGANEPKRYLLVFQNNAEARPTGGFMGSFALVDVKGGKIANMEIPGGGSYDLKGSLGVRVASPQPLHLINPRWQFQDANWYPDFPSSAKQITWFYDKSGGPTTDGVIAVNATLMEKLLAVTGPIEMPKYGKTISAQNFYYETQRAVEVEYDKTANRPKQFIADLAPMMVAKLTGLDRDATVKMAAALDDALATKDVQVWLRDEADQAQIAKLGWTGETKRTSGDYLAIVHTNIAGQKTDMVMHEDVRHETKIMPDGTGIVTLTVSRAHRGEKGAMFSGVRNVDYMRVYAPKGAMLVEAHGFTAPDAKLFKIGDAADGSDAAVGAQESGAKVDRDSGTTIYEEGDKTVFGNWVQTDPGETSVVTLVYQLPPGLITVTRQPEGRLESFYGKLTGNDRDRLDYGLLVQKQSGTNAMTFTSSVDFPRGFTPSWQLPNRTQDERGSWTVTANVDRDAFFGTVAEGR